MKDRIVLITGATGGIGRVTALELARQGAHVVIVGRDATRTPETAQALARESGNAKVEHLLADLSSMDAVRSLAASLHERYPRIDVLLHNAGAIHDKRSVTVDGYERTFATNHLAPFLLTALVRPLLEKSESARVVTVASEAGRYGSFHFDDVMCERSYGAYRAYNQSKLANIAFALELAERLRGTRITSNALHPGVVATGFGHNTEGWLKWLVKLGAPFILSAERGARTSVYLASSPEVEGVTGSYFIRSRPRRPPSAAEDPKNRKRLWELSERLTKLG